MRRRRPFPIINLSWIFILIILNDCSGLGCSTRSKCTYWLHRSPLPEPLLAVPIPSPNDAPNMPPTPIPSSTRRQCIVWFLSTYTLATSYQPCVAQDLWDSVPGDSFTQSITESELGTSVRRAVVRGAQLFDKVDQQWEQFSDKFHLGSERSQTMDRPRPKPIPARKPIDSVWAHDWLQVTDETFTSILAVPKERLESRIQQLDSLVQKSFFPSSTSNTGQSLANNSGAVDDSSHAFFNYLSYLHFKTYCQLINQPDIPFSSIRTRLEDTWG
jgi:hypothetical protein